MTPAVVAKGLRKRYGGVEALGGVDLEIQQGEVFALLGPNGAGKTTFVEILEGYRQRSGGDALVLGADPGQPTRTWRAQIGIVLQNTTVFDNLTVQEVVSHFASFYPQPLDVRRVIELVGLEEKRNARCGKLSGGQKRRVDLAVGLVGNPQLMFLDEPTTGLDPEGRRQLWDVVRDFAALGKTVVLTTHYLDEAEALANRVAVIIAGQLAAVGAPATLGGREEALATVRFERNGRLHWPLPRIPSEVINDGPEVSIATREPTEAVRQLAKWAEEQGVAELPGLVVSRPSLEDIYLQMVHEAGGVASRGGD